MPQGLKKETSCQLLPVTLSLEIPQWRSAPLNLLTAALTGKY